MNEDDQPLEGQVFICGGVQLALPGTAVAVFNATLDVTGSTCATGVDGTAIDPECEDSQQACAPDVISARRVPTHN